MLQYVKSVSYNTAKCGKNVVVCNHRGMGGVPFTVSASHFLLAKFCCQSSGDEEKVETIKKEDIDVSVVFITDMLSSACSLVTAIMLERQRM